MHASVADLELVGGHPALDLVNTVEPRVRQVDTEPHDHLVDAVALLQWSARAELVADAEVPAMRREWAAEPEAAQRALGAVREIREALYAVLLTATGAEPVDAAESQIALERLQLRWAAAAGRSRLVLDPDGPAVARIMVGSAPGFLLADRVAAAAVDLLSNVDSHRLRQCPPEHGGCGWVFLDRTRNGSRRWCQMADCGTQAKMRRLTERRRAARALPAKARRQES